MKKASKILVVDDEMTVTRLLQSILTGRGYEVITASNGQEALEKYQSCQPDLILLDIIMPQMDGYTFVLEFKQRGGNFKKTPIIVLSTKDKMQDIFQIEGINDYIIKPFETDHLIRKIEKRLASQDKKILVVDDEADIVGIIENRLKASGYTVITAFNGLDGLERAKREAPDLMVLDVMMPKLDGYRVCRMLKFDEKYKNIPIVLLTARSQENDALVSKQVRADAHLQKPYDGKVLLQLIKELLWD